MTRAKHHRRNKADDAASTADAPKWTGGPRQEQSGLFPALLKHWRGQRGLSQLDLALAADVSPRHVSFLETGRSSPSREMVHRLGRTLDVPLRHINGMLVAAGHEAAFAESAEALPEPVMQSLSLLKAKVEPYPFIVVDRLYRVRDLNDGARAVLSVLLPGAEGLGGPSEINLARETFGLFRPVIVNFEEVGRALLWRMHREVLAQPDDGALRALLDEILGLPMVPAHWRHVDLGVPSDPTLVLHVRRGEVDLRFLNMITAFQAPQNVALEELRIEIWLPSDAATQRAVEALRTPRLDGV